MLAVHEARRISEQHCEAAELFGDWFRVLRLTRRFELPKIADKVRLDTPLNHSAVAFGFLAVDAGAATALCGTNGWSIGDTYFRVFDRSVCSFRHLKFSPCEKGPGGRVAGAGLRRGG